MAYSGLRDPWGQDFELALAEVNRVPILAKLMDDKETVNKHDFFRLVLYVITGQTLNPNLSTNNENIIEREKLLKIIESLVEKDMSSELKLWRDRTYYLDKNPESYVEQDWEIGSKFLKQKYEPCV